MTFALIVLEGKRVNSLTPLPHLAPVTQATRSA